MPFITFDPIIKTKNDAKYFSHSAGFEMGTQSNDKRSKFSFIYEFLVYLIVALHDTQSENQCMTEPDNRDDSMRSGKRKHNFNSFVERVQ